MSTYNMTTHTLNMKTRVPIITTRFMIAGLLAMAMFVGVEQNLLAVEPQTDPAYMAHSTAAASQAGGQADDAQLAEMRARIQQMEAIIQQQTGQSPAAGAMPMPMGAGNIPRIRPMPGIGSNTKPMQGKMADMNMTGGRKGGMGGGRAVADRLAEMRAKMQRLEATMQQQAGSTSGAMPMSGMPGIGSGTKPMQGKMVGMSDMGTGNPPFGGAPVAMKPTGGMGGMSGMSGDTSPPGGEMGMMMNKMMGMMDKMMGGSMGGGTMPTGAPRGKAAAQGGGGESMDMGTMDMGKTSKMGKPDKTGKMSKTSKTSKTSKMSKMEMMEMMGGMGDSSMAMPSALPGNPGTSHLYHIGATGFFLDHPRHIALGMEQQMMLNQIKEQATLDKANADRCVQEAEQDLWMLTAANQPDYVQIEAKIAQIEKLRGDVRLRFIGAIGRAAIILNDKQRKILTGFAPPVSVPHTEARKGGRMKGM